MYDFNQIHRPADEELGNQPILYNPDEEQDKQEQRKQEQQKLLEEKQVKQQSQKGSVYKIGNLKIFQKKNGKPVHATIYSNEELSLLQSFPELDDSVVISGSQRLQGVLDYIISQKKQGAIQAIRCWIELNSPKLNNQQIKKQFTDLEKANKLTGAKTELYTWNFTTIPQLVNNVPAIYREYFLPQIQEQVPQSEKIICILFYKLKHSLSIFKRIKPEFVEVETQAKFIDPDSFIKTQQAEKADTPSHHQQMFSPLTSEDEESNEAHNSAEPNTAANTQTKRNQPDATPATTQLPKAERPKDTQPLASAANAPKPSNTDSALDDLFKTLETVNPNIISNVISQIGTTQPTDKAEDKQNQGKPKDQHPGSKPDLAPPKDDFFDKISNLSIDKLLEQAKPLTMASQPPQPLLQQQPYQRNDQFGANRLTAPDQPQQPIINLQRPVQAQPMLFQQMSAQPQQPSMAPSQLLGQPQQSAQQQIYLQPQQ